MKRLAGGRIRGLLLALPVVVIVGALLSSADAVFASFFRLPDLPDVWLHLVLLSIGAFAAGGYLGRKGQLRHLHSARAAAVVVQTVHRVCHAA